MFTYIHPYVQDPDGVFAVLTNDLAWVRREGAPRWEYYVNPHGVPYTYGGKYPRTYEPQANHPAIAELRAQVEETTGALLDVCFLNRYEGPRDHLGWHADDSPEMDHDRPIAIVSLGAEREIWFKEKEGGALSVVSLQHGSLCVMPAGFQRTHLHRIPKASFQCGPRISLTHRGYVKTL